MFKYSSSTKNFSKIKQKNDKKSLTSLEFKNLYFFTKNILCVRFQRSIFCGPFFIEVNALSFYGKKDFERELDIDTISTGLYMEFTLKMQEFIKD